MPTTQVPFVVLPRLHSGYSCAAAAGVDWHALPLVKPLRWRRRRLHPSNDDSTRNLNFRSFRSVRFLLLKVLGLGDPIMQNDAVELTASALAIQIQGITSTHTRADSTLCSPRLATQASLQIRTKRRPRTCVCLCCILQQQQRNNLGISKRDKPSRLQK